MDEGSKISHTRDWVFALLTSFNIEGAFTLAEREQLLASSEQELTRQALKHMPANQPSFAHYITPSQLLEVMMVMKLNLSG